MYDSNDYLNKPDLLTTEAYTRRRADLKSDNCAIKSIVKPKDVKYNGSPHFCKMKFGKKCVGSDYEEIKLGNSKDCNIDIIRLNHYYCRSKEEYLSKTAKGYADQLTVRKFINERYIFNTETEIDTCIYKYLPELKKRLNLLDNHERCSNNEIE